MKQLLVVLLSFGACAPAWAQTSTDISADYALYIVGLRIAEIHAHLVYTPRDYAVDIRTHTTGVAKILVTGDQAAEARGTWNGVLPVPARYATTGTWNGDPRRTTITFADGMPTVTLLVPPEKPDHAPIPPDMLRDDIDTLSGFAELVRQIAATGKCDQHAHNLDGLHVLEVTARTVGEEILPREEQSGFSGKALRCDFEGKMIAGYTRGEEHKQRRVLHASAWLARLTPSGPPMPIKAQFETRYFGDAEVHLVVPGEQDGK